LQMPPEYSLLFGKASAASSAPHEHPHSIAERAELQCLHLMIDNTWPATKNFHVCMYRAPVPRKRKGISSGQVAKPLKATAEGAEQLVDLWDTEPTRASAEGAEDFEDEAQAIAARKRTAHGYVRPQKRR
jgi:hypothetical protein